MSGEILTLFEIAQRLKVAEKTVYTMIGKGDLPVFKVRGNSRVHRAKLDSCIDAKTRRVAGEEKLE